MITPSNAPFQLPNANPETAKYIIFEGIRHHNRFFSTNCPNTDQTLLDDGTKAYIILGYSNTIAEAQMYLYGRVSTERED